MRIGANEFFLKAILVLVLIVILYPVE